MFRWGSLEYATRDDGANLNSVILLRRLLALQLSGFRGTPLSTIPVDECLMNITRSTYLFLFSLSLPFCHAVGANGQLSQADDSSVSSSLSADDSKSVEHSVFRPIIPDGPPSPFAKKDKAKPLKVKIYPMYNKLPNSGKCLIALELQVKSGWHINANPSNPDFLVPTTVELKTEQKVKLSKTKYPKAHPLRVQGSPDPYHVYDGKAMVYGLLEIDEPSDAKFVDLEFHVRFQGCNSTQCLPPDLVVMKGKLPLAAEGEELRKVNADKFPKPATKSGVPKAAPGDEAPVIGG